MGKDIIGKRTRIQIGGEPPKKDDPGTIVGHDTTVHVSAADARKYDRIVGEEVRVTVGGIDDAVKRIQEAAGSVDTPQKDEITAICREILEEKEQSIKAAKAEKLLRVIQGVGALAQLAATLASVLGG